MAKKKETGTEVAVVDDLTWAPLVTVEEDLSGERLPSLHLITSASNLAKEGKVAAGTFVNMSTGEELGKEVTVIPFWYGKVWRRYKPGQNNPAQVCAAKTNRDFKWSHREDPEGLDSKFCFDFYVYIPGHEAMPFSVSFQSTNQEEGKRLAALMNNSLPPCKRAIKLTSQMKKAKKSDNKWMAKDWEVDREATPEEIMKCHKWQQMVVEYHPNIFYTADDIKEQPSQTEMF